MLVCWSVFALGAAEYVRRLQLSERAQMIAGAIEVVLAIATGIAFGITALGTESSTGSSDRQP